MTLEALLKRDDILDIRMSQDTLYVLCTTPKNLPFIVSDKDVVLLTQQDLTDAIALDFYAATSLRSDAWKLQKLALIEYDVSSLPASAKQGLSHTLSGTGGRVSVLEQWNARKVGKGAVLIPLAYLEHIREVFARAGAPITITTLYGDDAQ